MPCVSADTIGSAWILVRVVLQLHATAYRCSRCERHSCRVQLRHPGSTPEPLLNFAAGDDPAHSVTRRGRHQGFRAPSLQARAATAPQSRMPLLNMLSMRCAPRGMPCTEACHALHATGRLLNMRHCTFQLVIAALIDNCRQRMGGRAPCGASWMPQVVSHMFFAGSRSGLGSPLTSFGG
jgi:hypothetical protein